MYLKWIVASIVLLSGLLIMANTFRSSRRLFYARDARLSEYVISSVLSGAWACLVLLGIILALGALDAEYQWTVNELIGAIVLGLIVGLVAAAGSLWQYYVVGKFREALYRWLKKRPDK